MRFNFAFALLTAAATTLAASPALDSVVKLRAVDGDGTASFGSGVVIGPDRVATTCHVTRTASTIELYHADRHWIARAQEGSIDQDVCVLTVPYLDLPALPRVRSSSLHLHEPVIAAGFPAGGDLSISEGRVEDLYAFEGGAVIRTSAHFDFGASGGALLDSAGNLVGLLAFKSRKADGLRFALPIEWLLAGTQVASRFTAVTSAAGGQAFWERGKATQPPFLQQALLQATSQR